MNNNWKKIVGIVLLTIAVSFATVKLTSSKKTSTAAKISVYDNVLKTGVIRACYVVYPPASIKDPNNGKMSGVFIEALNKAAENMDLKVQWNAELNWGEMIEALNSGKCDIIGSTVWSNSARGRSAEFSQPLYYSAIGAYVRTNDKRLDNGIQIANNKNFKLATIDGEVSQNIASKQFPQAQTLQLPQTTDISQMLMNVADGKADIAFLEPTTANEYIKNNPGKVKNISTERPVVIYGNVMMIKKGEFTFKTMVDSAITELLDSGYVEELISKYEKDYPGGFYRVAAPYSVPQK